MSAFLIGFLLGFLSYHWGSRILFAAAFKKEDTVRKFVRDLNHDRFVRFETALREESIRRGMQ